MKMVTVNTLESLNSENENKMHFSRQAHCQKDEKCSFFGSIFAKARLGFHFLFIFLSFSVSILRKMETKWNGKWFKNERKMNRKCQLWTTLIGSCSAAKKKKSFNAVLNLIWWMFIGVCDMWWNAHMFSSWPCVMCMFKHAVKMIQYICCYID